MCINSFDILFPQSISFQNIECLCTIRRAGNYLETWPLGVNARSCCSHMPQSSTSFFFLAKLPFSHLHPRMWQWKNSSSSLSSSPSILVTPRLVVSVCVRVCLASAAPRISVVSRGMGVMKHSPVDTHGSVEHEFQLHWTEFQSSRAASQPARNKQHPNLPNCPWCVNNPSTPVTPEMGNTVLRKAGKLGGVSSCLPSSSKLQYSDRTAGWGEISPKWLQSRFQSEF